MKPITEKQKCIAEQSVYRDLMILDVYGALDEFCHLAHNSNNIKPILRPLSDLTKEITHKGYNDDKPFVPLVELAKLLIPCYDWYVNEFDVATTGKGLGNYSFWYLLGSFRYVRHMNTDETLIVDSPLELYDLLNQWHFDTRQLIESGDAVSTDDYDVYSVK